MVQRGMMVITVIIMMMVMLRDWKRGEAGVTCCDSKEKQRSPFSKHKL